jgi:hypothetical protein
MLFSLLIKLYYYLLHTLLLFARVVFLSLNSAMSLLLVNVI